MHSAIVSIHIHPDVHAEVLGESTVLLSLTSDRMYELNETGTAIWKALGESLTLNAIVEQLVSEFDVQPQSARDELLELVSKLEQLGLVVVKR